MELFIPVPVPELPNVIPAHPCTPQFAIEKWRFAKQIQIPEFTIDMLQSDRAKNSPALQHLQVDLQTNIKFNNLF